MNHKICITFYVISALFVSRAVLAGTQAECVTFARDFNDAHKGKLVFGLDITYPETPKLVLAKKVGYRATMREQSSAAQVMRSCLTSSLGNRFGKMNLGESKALFCQIREFENFYGPCDDNPRAVKFKGF